MHLDVQLMCGHVAMFARWHWGWLCNGKPTSCAHIVPQPRGSGAASCCALMGLMPGCVAVGDSDRWRSKLAVWPVWMHLVKKWPAAGKPGAGSVAHKCRCRWCLGCIGLRAQHCWARMSCLMGNGDACCYVTDCATMAMGVIAYCCIPYYAVVCAGLLMVGKEMWCCMTPDG